MSGEPNHGGPGIHTLAPELRALIVDALCEVDSLSEEQGQGTFLSYLSTSARRQVPTGSPVAFAERLTDHCVRHFAFLGLSRWLLAREDGSRQAAAVVELVRPFVEREENETLSALLFDAAAADLDEVRRQLTPIACAGVVRVAYEKVRKDVTAWGSLPPPSTVWETLVALSEFTAVDGEPPVRVMCTQLSRLHPELSCAGLLSQWGSTSRWRVLLDDGAVVDVPARLVVWVNPGARRDRYELESWAVLSQRGGQEPEFLERWVDRDVHRDEIAVRVGDRLDRVEADVRVDHHPALRVEVITSLSLMSALRVELWQSQEAVGRGALGTRAEMVYRAVEVTDHRIGAAQKVRRLVQERWGALENRGKAPAVDLFHTGGCDERLIPSRLGNEHVICLSVPGGLKRPVKHVLRALDVGVPVIVWHSGSREGSICDWLNPVRMEGEVTLTADQVYGLPAALLRSRSETASEQDSVYVEDGFAVAMMFHDQLPVLPPQTPRISPESIR